jgi:hypothetical protein
MTTHTATQAHGVPDAVRGMAHYSLACVQASPDPAVNQPDTAVASLARAVELNPDLLANIGRDADLAALREAGRLDALLAGR